MAWLFWLSIGAIVYVYAGYPCVLYLWKAYRGLRNADRGLDCGLRNAAGGKALALNAGVAAARHDIIVYADARQVFAPDALRELVAPFVDPAVGGVTGELLLDAESPCRRRGRDRRASERRAGVRAHASD